MARASPAVALTVCRFTTRDRARWLSAAEAWLTDAERAHAGTLRDPDGRAGHAIGRAMMRLAGCAEAPLARRRPAGPSSPPLVISTSPGGKPYLAAFPQLQMSLAHTEQVVVLASVVGIAVGVDIERPDPAPSYPLRRLAERRFSPSEADWLREIPDDELGEWFARVWTVKEAVGKALGTGFGPALSGVVVQARAGRLALVDVPAPPPLDPPGDAPAAPLAPPPPELWTLHELCAPDGGERIAVALAAPDVGLRPVSRLTLADLSGPRVTERG